MSHSIIKDTPTPTDNTLVIVVGQDGSISVDQETLDSLINMGSHTTEVSVVRVNEDEGSTVDMTLDTYQHTDIMDDLTINVEEVQRNYNNFRMDHCYTPLTSPSQRHPIPIDDPNEPDLELDDLAQTLSILEGSDKPPSPPVIVPPIKVPPPPPPTPIKTPHRVIKEQKNLPQNDKVSLLNKVNKFGVTKVYKGVKTVLNKTQKVIKKTVQNDVSDDSDDDYNDSDFEINDSPRTKLKRTYKRRNRVELPEGDNVKQKVVKVRKGVKNIIYKPPPKVIVEPKIEPVPIPDPVKSPEVKKPPKKEKKIPKPIIDDGIALFSTPDIIRRVGSDKPCTKPDKPLENSPEALKTPKPAKIEDRSHSDSARTSVDSKSKLPQRLSLDSKILSEKPKTEEIKERRNSDKVEKVNSIEPLMYPQNTETIVPLPENTAIMEPNVYNNIPTDVKSIEPVVPSVDDMSAMINTNNPPVIVPVEGTALPTETPIGLEAPVLDIDHAILDNINTDELISEDILYQVAKLVENPDVQNAIDKTLGDGSLALDPTIQQQIQQAAPQTQIQETVQPLIQQGIPNHTNTNNTNVPQIKTPQRQVVRSDGRVLVLPPIEKPATRSSKKKQETVENAPTPQRQQVQQQPIQHHAPRHQAKIEEIESELPPSDVESDSDESWNSEDDPDRLWCICKQPHNNRFMICCDTCEDWFHGKCVNVTKAMGQQMEQQGKEWMCPNCVKKQNTEPPAPIMNAVPPPNKIHAVAEKIDSSNHRKSADSPACIVCGAPSRASSVYCSDQCILKHAQGVERETKQSAKNQSQRIIVFERSTGKCLSGNNAPSAANLKQWLKEHPGFEVVRPVNNKTMAQSKLQLVKNSTGKVQLAVNRKGVQVGVLPQTNKPVTQIRLIPASKLNMPGMKTQVSKQVTTTTPNKTKIIPPPIKSPTPQPTTPAKPPKVAASPKVEKKEPKVQKKPEPPPPVDKAKAQENIRDNVKKTLFEQLMARLKEVDDLTLPEDEVQKIANEIELQLYKLFGDAGPKYRTKYRSLIFNIKDTKNHTLWRRICDKAIAPAQLVRLSPDDLANQELARWRERETKHQLEMIKKSELEMLSINRTYVLKTHKGEHVMEDKVNKVDSADIMPGLGADSTSEEVTTATEKSDGNEHNSERKNSKHSRKDRERKSSKERSSDGKDRKSSKEHGSSRDKRRRSRSRDRDRNSHRSDRKRSRSRDRHHRSSHKSSRHKRDRHSIDYLDKKSKEILDSLENNKIVAPPEDRLWKHVPQQDIQVATPIDSDSDHEPTSTVTIPTPPRSTEQEDQNPPIPPIDIAKIEAKLEAAVKTPRSDPRLNRAVTETKIQSPPPPKPIEETLKEVPIPIEAKITSLSAETIVWEGNINMIDVAKFFITLHEVSGDCNGIGSELPATLEIVGRISPDTVWEYIGKMRRSNSKMISILRLTAANMEEKMPYIALYSYLSSRNRLGVIKSTNSAVKDFYILPLASHAPVPQSLLPLSGPGFEESRPHLLLGIIVRAKRKRQSITEIVSVTNTKRTRIETPPPVVVPPVIPPPPPRSYTPPPNRDPRLKLPIVPTLVENTTTNDEDEPYSPEDSDPETGPLLPDRRVKPVVPELTSLLTTAATPAASLNTDISSVLNATLKTNTFLDGGASAIPSFEPFSNKFDGIPGLDVDTGVDSLQRKMEELDKCIEKQKEEIRNISQDIVSSGAAERMATNLSNISLPSNLQQILDSIKNIPATTNLESQDSLPPDEYSPSVSGYKTAPVASEELTIPLLLPKLSSRSQSLGLRSHTPPEPPTTPTIPLQLPVTPRETIPLDTLSLPNLNLPTHPPHPMPNTNIPLPVLPTMNLPSQVPLQNMSSAPTPTIPLNLPKIKPKIPPISALSPPGTTPVIIPPIIEQKIPEPKSVLSSLSEEELIRKANEMLGEAETAREETPEPDIKEKVPEFVKPTFKSAPVMYNTLPPPKRPKIDIAQPPIPGLEEDEY